MIQTFLITWVTHNSRISERMRIYEEKIIENRENNPRFWDGLSVEFDGNEEVEIMGYFAEIICEDNLKILVINICRDHVHMVIVCEELELIRIVQKLKWWSSFLFWKRRRDKVASAPCESNEPESKGLRPLVWSVDKETLVPCKDDGKNSKGLKPLVWPVWAQKINSVILPDEKSVYNACYYVFHNRQKHGLSENRELLRIAQSALVHLQDL